MIYDESLSNEQEEVEKARAITRRHYGSALAEKSSGDLCKKLAAGVQWRSASRFDRRELLAMQPAGVPLVAENTIIEFSGAGFSIDALQVKAAEVWASLEKVIADINRSPIEVILRSQQIIQQQRIKNYREKVLQAISQYTGHLENRIEKAFAQEAASLNNAGRLTTTCWLDQTVRTIADASVLAGMATDVTIDKLDIPRPLQAEINSTSEVVDAAAYRGRSAATGKGIIVAVIDGEVDINHTALAGRVVHRKNYTREPWGGPDSHGTAVAGIIAANDAVYSGMAPGATIYSYKVLATNPAYSGTNFDGRLAIQNALEDGAHIANCSWGDGPAGNGTGKNAEACNNAWNLGLTIVKSAGNRGPGAGTLTSPADADGVIVVGATGKDGKQVEDYSSRGPSAHGQVRPHILAPGGSIAGGIFSCAPGNRFSNVGAGTSFAAPHISGLLALILEQHDLSPDEQRNYLLQIATALPGFGGNDQGYGLVSMITKP